MTRNTLEKAVRVCESQTRVLPSEDTMTQRTQNLLADSYQQSRKGQRQNMNSHVLDSKTTVPSCVASGIMTDCFRQTDNFAAAEYQPRWRKSHI